MWFRIGACLLIAVAVLVVTQPWGKSESTSSSQVRLAPPAAALNSSNNVFGDIMAENSNLEIATLGGGCFWCLEAVFELVKGVEAVRSGYSGGGLDNPSYEQVCSGQTGHAEVIQIAFDPKVISYEELLDVFFTIHDPTTLNRQGNDTGTQYRSVIYYHSPSQHEAADRIIAKLAASKEYSSPIVTEVTEFSKFYPAEDYHQGYFRAHGRQPYCQFVVSPKIAKFRSKFADRLKE